MGTRGGSGVLESRGWSSTSETLSWYLSPTLPSRRSGWDLPRLRTGLQSPGPASQTLTTPTKPERDKGPE